jgi:predicted PurR-regulated permease PerM
VVKLEIPFSQIVKVVAVFFAAYLLFLLRDVFLIVLTAIVVASAIEPITAWFKRHQIDRVYAVVIVYLLSAIILFGAVYFFIPSVVAQFQALANQFPSYVESLGTGSDVSSPILGSIKNTVPLEGIFDSVRVATTDIVASPVGVFNVVFGGLVSFALIVVISFYLAVQEDGVANFLRIISPRSYEYYVIDLWRRTRKKIGAWLQGQLLLSLIVGVFSFIGLWILGVEGAFLLAVLAGMFELIPLFGPILASIPAILVGFVDGGVELGLLVALLYFVIQQLENHVFHPIVVKKVVGVPAIIVIISLLIGAQLAGFLGLILAVPMAAGLMEFVSDLESFKSSDHKSIFELVSLKSLDDK